ncbi:hypothetical protein DFH09DRAFT_1307645 [Mycena vulgaris]|nr:hypothetical protein DFH09DRAFT_1307645 [Mycena vulgaris]
MAAPGSRETLRMSSRVYKASESLPGITDSVWAYRVIVAISQRHSDRASYWIHYVEQIVGDPTRNMSHELGFKPSQQVVHQASHLSANLGDAVPDIRQTFSDAANSWVDLAAALHVPDYDLGPGKILDLKTRTFSDPTVPANAAVEPIPSVSAITTEHCDFLKNGLPKDLGETGSKTADLTGNFLEASRNAFMDVSVSEIPQSVVNCLRLYFLDSEVGVVGGLAALWGWSGLLVVGITRQAVSTAEGYPHMLATLCPSSLELLQKLRQSQTVLAAAVLHLAQLMKNNDGPPAGMDDQVEEVKEQEDAEMAGRF